ncbi:MAG: AmmeMemoRadiSam system protein A [Candidatus Abyssobacteria bacterium SURF_5]|uniref:AmmeMemoRadiSam system protein A n=1 Tax=Abyssobacteria bacterium (strain SURF_5) TaxID=2093360 RepID=A0A3A4NM09_ABYX5|nr:MAG: AmmeMemoRadiSam system protein A [Candidatus Abyssubacteria bacterium SURF_5]
MLSLEEQDFLIETARRTIIEYVTSARAPEVICNHARLNEKCGAFVTLHEKNGALRGCIGYVEPIKPLVQTIIDMSIACSTKDPRFSPVTEGELANLDLEISILSSLEEIDNPQKILIGTHGLLIKKEFATGLLLPQVAVEFGWDRYRFLRETCRKAGLATDDWKKPDSRLFIFSAQIFRASLL